MTRRLGLLLLLVAAPAIRAQAPVTFPDVKHGKGDMRHIDGIPVLTLRGTPAETGDQFGVLAGRNSPGPGLNGLHAEFLKDAKLTDSAAGITILAKRLKANIPAHQLAEIEAMAAAGLELDLLLFAATVYDLSSGMGCSTIVVEKERSQTGQPLFGRNFDWLPSKWLPEHTLVVVHKAHAGRRAFATVTISPITGCISGMNDAGLSCTINEIHLKQSKDKASFDWSGVPILLAFRRVLEDCATVAEAEKLLRGMKRTTSACLTICDANGGAVFEITPKSLEVRAANNGVTCCTNHFCTDKLATPDKCWRLPKLLALQQQRDALGVDDVFAKLGEVHQTKHTLQSMVFEPSAKVLHLKLGDGKTTATGAKAVRLELGKLFAD